MAGQTPELRPHVAHVLGHRADPVRAHLDGAQPLRGEAFEAPARFIAETNACSGESRIP